MNREAAFAWAKSLRENADRKGRNALASSDRKYFCCLGWLCQMHGYQFTNGQVLNPKGEREFHSTVQSRIPQSLADKLNSRLLAKGDDWHESDTVIIKDRKYHSLAQANDSGATWPEIADWIEANYEKL